MTKHISRKLSQEKPVQDTLSVSMYTHACLYLAHHGPIPNCNALHFNQTHIQQIKVSYHQLKTAPSQNAHKYI